MKSLSPIAKYSLGAMSLLIASHASADTIFGIYAGAGTWQSEYSGSVGNPSATMDELGFDEALLTGICLVEWPDRLGDGLWGHALRLNIDFTEDNARRLTADVPDAWTDRWSQI